MITWGTKRAGDGVLCAVFCLECREVFGRDLTPVEAGELKEEIEVLHTAEQCKENGRKFCLGVEA